MLDGRTPKNECAVLLVYSGALVKEDEDVVFVLNWYLGVYSGKVESSAL